MPPGLDTIPQATSWSEVHGVKLCPMGHVHQCPFGKKSQLVVVFLKGNIWGNEFWDTVDGRNPAPPGMYKTLQSMGQTTYQLVQDFFHQQYVFQNHTHESRCPKTKKPMSQGKISIAFWWVSTEDVPHRVIFLHHWGPLKWMAGASKGGYHWVLADIWKPRISSHERSAWNFGGFRQMKKKWPFWRIFCRNM